MTAALHHGHGQPGHERLVAEGHGPGADGHDHPELEAGERARLGRRAQLLAGASVAYNSAEGVIAVTAGTVAGSAALVGFGLDSAVEVSSALVVLWQFRSRRPQSRERLAQRLIALSFLALALFVAQDSLRALLSGDEPGASRVGIVLASVSLVLMPFLSWAQRRTGRALHSGSVVADSAQTMLCTYLSAVLLGGLVLNATLGWGWADPVAGLVIAAVALKEGRDAWRGRGCCRPAAATPAPAPAAVESGTCTAPATDAEGCCR